MTPIALTQTHMGGTWSILCYPSDRQGGSQDESFVRGQMKKAFAEVERLENLLTDFHSSPLNDINLNAGIRPVPVCDEIYHLIETSIQYSKESQGAFDITYASVGKFWRETRQKNIEPSLAEINDHLEWVDYRKIVLDDIEKTVFLPHKKIRIGLGGIGKGYAVDQAFKILKQNGLSNFYINGSGDIRFTAEVNAPRPWRIGIRNPLSTNPHHMMGVLQIREGAVATSGDYINYILINGKKCHHIINPLTGHPGFGAASSTIISTTAMDADVAATIAMVKGQLLGIKYLNQRKLKGMIVADTGQVFMSQEALKQMEVDGKIILSKEERKCELEKVF